VTLGWEHSHDVETADVGGSTFPHLDPRERPVVLVQIALGDRSTHADEGSENPFL
jgi:hypothetical protein